MAWPLRVAWLSVDLPALDDGNLQISKGTVNSKRPEY